MSKHVTETIEQFLSRGGKITVVPSGPAAAAAEYNKSVIAKKPSSGAASLMTMEDADLFYGETKAKPKVRASKQPTLDVNALPAELKKKFVDNIIEEKEDEEEEN